MTAEYADIMEEVAEAERKGLKPEHRAVPEPIGHEGMTYKVPPEDQAAWVPGWELKVDRWGEEYGVPVRMPRMQLGLWLNKRREADGGRRFTVRPPAKLAALPQFECFANDNCHKRVDTRAKLVDHIERNHQQEAKIYEPFMQQLRDAVVTDNTRLAALVTDMAQRQDQGVIAVSREVQQEIAQQLPAVDETAGLSPVATVTGRVQPAQQIYYCRVPGCGRFFDSEHGVRTHCATYKKGDLYEEHHKRRQTGRLPGEA